MKTPHDAGRQARPLRRALVTVAGGTLCMFGVALLVLPGPGLLLVLGGLVLLASEYRTAAKLVDPVRTRALQAAREGLASPARIAATILCGLGLIGAGIAWILVPGVPFANPASGACLALSGIILLALLGYAYRRLPGDGAPPAADSAREPSWPEARADVR
jgi:hypothetical protein